MPPITFEAAAAMQPRLWALLADARACPADDWPRFARTVKAPLRALVGWGADDAPAALRTSEAYDAVYRRLADEHGADAQTLPRAA
jgi:hypothetical protein